MAITISPLTEHEIPEAVRIELEAFRSHPRIPALWTHGYTPELYAFYESKKRDTLRDPQGRLVKASDGNGNMLAVSEWTFALDPAKQAEKEPVDPNGQPPSNWPPGGNWEMRRFFNLNSEKWVREYMGGKAHIQLDILVVNPSLQGKGVGTKLLAWGMEQADKNGVPLCLEATPRGLPLYKRFGFEVKDVLMADMKQFGWNEEYEEEAAKRVWMIRQPVEQRQNQ